MAARSPCCPWHRSHPTRPWPRVGSGDLLCPMSSCLVYVRVSGCDPELASPFKFLPLGSAHTVHKASQRNATWKKKIHPRRRKTTSQQNVLLSAGSSAWLQFSQCLPLGHRVCTPLLFPTLQHQQCHPTAGQGAPTSCPHPQGSSLLPRGWAPAQSHTSQLLKNAFVQLASHITPLASAFIHPASQITLIVSAFIQLSSHIVLSASAFIQCCA